MNKRIIIILNLFILSNFCPAWAGNDVRYDPKFIKAEIYYYGWDVFTRSMISLESVRNSPKIRISIIDPGEVLQFVKWLRLEEMLETQDKPGLVQREDPRLVIDLFDSKNTQTTYYASWFNLLSQDSRKKRPIDETFRNKFFF